MHDKSSLMMFGKGLMLKLIITKLVYAQINLQSRLLFVFDTGNISI